MPKTGLKLDTERYLPGWSVTYGKRDLLRTLFLSVLPILLIVTARSVLQFFRVEGPSMKPTLHDNQYLIVDRFVYRFRSPKHGDIAVLKCPIPPHHDCIKRVIGLPGEKIEIREGLVYINEQLIEDPYRTERSTYDWGPMRVPLQQYFVLGDNRDYSTDSRMWGCVPAKKIIGLALISYWPPQHWGPVRSKHLVSVGARRSAERGGDDGGWPAEEHCRRRG